MNRILKLMLLTPMLIWGQSYDQNFVQTTTYRDKASGKPSVSITYFDGLGRPIQKIAQQQSATAKDIVIPITYDSFGRQEKEYLPYVASSSDGSFQTNALTDQGSFYMNPKYENTSNAYSQKEFEASPLNRVFKQAAPGNDWEMGKGKEIKFKYEANTIADAVHLFKVSTSWISAKQLYDISISTVSDYAANELYKNVTVDENGKSSEEFKDKEGHVVLKRTFDGKTALDTYYVYDDYGNLTYVLPPLAGGQYTQNILDGLCYQYKYDHRNRLAAKKLPGKQWEFIVYDKLDRVVATGPALSPFSDSVGSTGWLVTKYDVFNRPILTAWYNMTVSEEQRGVVQSALNNATVLSETKKEATKIKGITFNYSADAWPTSGFDVLTVNYYDAYSFPHAEVVPTTVLGEPVYYNATQLPKGLPTGSWIRVLEKSSDTKATSSITYYDYKARPIRIKTNNHLGGYTLVDSQLDFMGKVLKTETRHKRTTNDSELLTVEAFTYSAEDRLLTHTHEINNNGKETLVRNTYDELGQLTSKNVGGTSSTGLQKIDYSYNIRGWLKAINDVNQLQKPSEPADLFAFKINYNDNDTAPKSTGEIIVPQLFNGNISETFWTTTNDNGIVHKYGYTYDDLNRLQQARFQQLGAAAVTHAYDECLRYDANGNIKELKRNGRNIDAFTSVAIDNLTYDYDVKNPNQLMKVSDAEQNSDGFKDGNVSGNDYAYDSNGNMIQDLNKGITKIDYNHLNLPVKILFKNSEQTKIEYLYDATGNKLAKKVFSMTTIRVPCRDDGAESMRTTSSTARGITRDCSATAPVQTTTQYLQGGYQYIDGNLAFVPHAEGFVKMENGVTYFYNYTDHLGNVRATYTDNPDAGGVQLTEESHYYPFGLKHQGYNTSLCLEEENGGPCISTLDSMGYKYKYNGKELQDELGLNMYDYGWRNYSPDIARWTQIDPLFNDLKFAHDNLDVDPDDHEEVYMSIINDLEIGGGIYNTDNLNPYGYGYNNPVSFDDPDGRCPSCIVGAVVGAVVDYGTQVASNYLDGKRGVEAWTSDISLSSIALSATEGALTQGGSALRKLAVKGAVAVASNTIDYSPTDGLKVEKNVSNILKNTAIDLSAKNLISSSSKLAGNSKILNKVSQKVNLSNNKAQKLVQKVTGLSNRTSNSVAKKLEVKKISEQLSNGIKQLNVKTLENGTNALTKKKLDEFKKKTSY